MQYKEVVKKIAEELSFDQKAVHAVLEAFQKTVRTTPVVSLYGFGRFWHKTIPAHVKRNPHTGGTVDVPEKTVLRFKAAKL